jgi:hypothetical protein
MPSLIAIVTLAVELIPGVVASTTELIFIKQSTLLWPYSPQLLHQPLYCFLKAARAFSSSLACAFLVMCSYLLLSFSRTVSIDKGVEVFFNFSSSSLTATSYSSGEFDRIWIIKSTSDC